MLRLYKWDGHDLQNMASARLVCGVSFVLIRIFLCAIIAKGFKLVTYQGYAEILFNPFPHIDAF